jgi:hypothetical protein
VTVYDASSCDGIDFVVMEYVDGETLAKRIPVQGMPVEEALRVGRAVAGCSQE